MGPTGPKGVLGPIGVQGVSRGTIGSNGPTGPMGTRGVTIGIEPRICPECKQEYYWLHPLADCSHGTVERIMET